MPGLTDDRAAVQPPQEIEKPPDAMRLELE